MKYFLAINNPNMPGAKVFDLGVRTPTGPWREVVVHVEIPDIDPSKGQAFFQLISKLVATGYIIQLSETNMPSDLHFDLDTLRRRLANDIEFPVPIDDIISASSKFMVVKPHLVEWLAPIMAGRKELGEKARIMTVQEIAASGQVDVCTAMNKVIDGILKDAVAYCGEKQ